MTVRSSGPHRGHLPSRDDIPSRVAQVRLMRDHVAGMPWSARTTAPRWTDCQHRADAGRPRPVLTRAGG